VGTEHPRRHRHHLHSRPAQALTQTAELLARNELVVKVQTLPFDRAAQAYRISIDGHVRGKLVLVP
jgi:hypothetical protein